MKKFLGFLAISGLLAFTAVPFATSDENTPQHCERKDPNDPNSEEICIPLPGVPSPSPQPHPAPGGSAETPEEPAPEAWESPNAGADDTTSSGKPDKPAKESSGSSGVGTGNSGGSSSGSKKPSVASSSSGGGKKPAGSDTSSSDSDDSTSGSSRPDTVCAGQFCGDGDTLIGGSNAKGSYVGGGCFSYHFSYPVHLLGYEYNYFRNLICNIFKEKQL